MYRVRLEKIHVFNKGAFDIAPKMIMGLAKNKPLVGEEFLILGETFNPQNRYRLFDIPQIEALAHFKAQFGKFEKFRIWTKNSEYSLEILGVTKCDVFEGPCACGAWHK